MLEEGAGMPSQSQPQQQLPKVDPARDCFPACIVWSPIWPLTALLPFIGHMGIGDSRGVMWDFAGPYTIGTRKLAFGAPTRFFQLTLQGAQEARAFDAAVQETNACYSQRMHNLCCDNCHSHVARALNTFGYAAYRRWNMVLLCFMVFFRGRFVSPGAVAKTWGPFAALVVVALVIKYK